jgi:predicted  nucleic acid-binding Zn-ribbon protein
MQQITLRIPVRTLAELEREARERGVSRSEHIRGVLAERHADSERIETLETRVQALEAELETLETECKRLKSEKRTLIERRATTQELVAYVEGEREQRQAWEEAGLATRARWWLFGRDRGDE